MPSFDSATVTLLIFLTGVIFSAGGIFVQLQWIRTDIKDIRTNHLPHINAAVEDLDDRIRKLEVAVAKLE